MRSLALALLVLVAVVYAVTAHRSGGWGYLHAAAEASMVGAIADWFAVTALFRRPLGLPIPHTALIPTRKAALGHSLQDFVADNFLSGDVVRARVAAADVSGRLAEWLARPGNAGRVVEEGSVLVTAALNRVESADVADVLRTELLPRLAEEPLSEPAGVLLAQVVETGAHHGVVDLLLKEGHDWLSVNEPALGRALSSRAPWWTPQWLDDKVVERIHQELVAWVRDIRDNPLHQARIELDDLLSRLAHDLQTNPDTIERAEELKRRMLVHPAVAASTLGIWEAVRTTVISALADPRGALRSRLEAAVVELAAVLRTDRDLAGRLDAYAADAAAFVVNRYGHDLTGVITDTIENWDGREAARRIELHVGRDLQFVRINGTLVGALAGLVIHALSSLL